MAWKLTIAFLLACAFAGPAAEAAEDVGAATLAFRTAGSDRAVNATLWYPAVGGGTPVRLGESAVFQGVDAQQDAEIGAGPYPLVLISHGGLRAAPHHGNWIAAQLAARGFVAAVVRGPTLGPGDAGMALQEISQRPDDLAAALTALLDDPTWSSHLDNRKAAAVGFFLGGTAALSLAGAQFDAEHLAASCDPGANGVDCAWFAENSVELRSADGENVTASHRDSRISAVIAVDPEYAASFSPESLTRIAIPVALVNLGRLDAVPPGLKAADLAAAIPGASYHTLPEASSFSAFAPCTAKGPDILKEEGESDAICREKCVRTREALHRYQAELISETLQRAFQITP